MATLSVYTAFDFHAAQNWSGAGQRVNLAENTVSFLKGSDVASFFGSIRQDGSVFKGPVYIAALKHDGIDQWQFTDSYSTGNYQMSDLQTLLLDAHGTQSYYGYLLKSDDVVYSTGLGSVLDGYDGTNTVSYASAKSSVSADLAKGLATTKSGTDKLYHFNGLTGSDYDDSLKGNDKTNYLDGGKGADSMSGGKGDDFYTVDNAKDAVIEARGGGEDTVSAVVDVYVLPANVENLNLTGVKAVGNALDNDIHIGYIGNPRHVTMDGGRGADNMLDGGQNDDTYIVDNVHDSVSESFGTYGGFDVIKSSVSFTASEGIDQLVLTGSDDINATAISSGGTTLIGNAGANVLDGHLNDNTLGQEGRDTLIGGAGNDTYVVRGSYDRVIEKAGQGTDAIILRGGHGTDFVLGSNVENLTIEDNTANATGNDLANVLTGTDKANILDGKAGADELIGLGGNDTYVVDDYRDHIVEARDGGKDSVQASVNFKLDSNVENLTLTGHAAIDAIGNALSNSLTGNDADNVLDGRGGADIMSGGRGDDIYVVDTARDRVIENSGKGADTVISSVSWRLSSTIEKLTLTGAGNLSGIGGDNNNVITGNSGDNVLDGGGGIDAVSYAGQHRVNVDLSAHHASGLNGIDVLRHFENIVGSSYDDVLAGDASANTITGGSGHDRFVLNDSRAADRLTDFRSGEDLIVIAQQGIHIGNGDHAVDHARSVLGPDGFSANDELVIVRGDVSGNLNRANAAAAIGHASGNYALGDTALFAVDNGHDTAIYLFTAANTDATVSVAELTLLASLTGTSNTVVHDYVFGS